MSALDDAALIAPLLPAYYAPTELPLPQHSRIATWLRSYLARVARDGGDVVKLLLTSGGVQNQSIEDALGLPVVQTLPQQSAAVTESISLGQPLVKTHPQNPVVDALRQVGANFLQTEAPKTKTWFSRWVGVHA